MGRITAALIVSSWVIPISILVNRIVPGPYMDEIFHIPQAQQYCQGNFSSWDPMITTPPGLYYLSLAHVASLFPGSLFIHGVSSFSELCTTSILRSVNGVLVILCSAIVYEIITLLRPNLDERKATIFAVVLVLYPLNWFFTFLYYTDVASLTTVLAMYLACLRKKYHLSALLGAFAIFIRQTNVIWMLFVACNGVMDITLTHQSESMKVDNINIFGKKTGHSAPNNRVIVSSNIRRRKPDMATDASTDSMMSSSSYLTSHSSGFCGEIQAICWASWHKKSKIFFSFIPFFVVLLTFAAFVYWNGSVVLGAKEAHAVSPHFAQLMYFSLVCSIASAPLHFSLSQALFVFRSFWKNCALSFCQWTVALAAGFISVHSFSIAHAYLLADNRHYTFYLWRKVIQSHWLSKYLLVLLYVYSWFSIIKILGKTRPKIWVLAYFLATAAVLVPAPLVEFRYYTIPFYFLMIHSHALDIRSLVLMGLGYGAINCFTMFMFLFRPFYWSHEPGIQRFIW